MRGTSLAPPGGVPRCAILSLVSGRPFAVALSLLCASCAPTSTPWQVLVDDTLVEGDVTIFGAVYERRCAEDGALLFRAQIEPLPAVHDDAPVVGAGGAGWHCLEVWATEGCEVVAQTSVDAWLPDQTNTPVVEMELTRAAAPSSGCGAGAACQDGACVLETLP